MGSREYVSIGNYHDQPYMQEKRGRLEGIRNRKGPKPAVPDSEVVEKIKADIKASPFKGEGHSEVVGYGWTDFNEN